MLAGLRHTHGVRGVEPRLAGQRYPSHWACAGKGACDGIRYIQTPLERILGNAGMEAAGDDRLPRNHYWPRLGCSTD